MSKTLLLAFVLLLLAPTAAAWSVTTPDVFGGSCQSAEHQVGGPSGPYAAQNGNCTWTVGCENLIVDLCE